MESFLGTRHLLKVCLLGVALAPSCGSNDTTSPSSSIVLTCSANPTSGTAPLAVSFQTVIRGGQPPFAVTIQFGDGTAGTDGTGTHIYARAGAFVVNETATSGGQSGSCSETITVAAPPPGGIPETPPHSVFKVNPNPPQGPGPLTVTFNMCASQDRDGDPLLFTYQFGDGTQVSGPNCRAAHTYTTRGKTFPASVCMNDGHHLVCKNYEVKVF
jgi:PKD repeat protein